jgi:PRTRC genetic system protein C
MSIEVVPIRRSFYYQGIALPDVPGMSPHDIRDLYSAQYPELVSAEVECGEVVQGVQPWTFRKAVGTKGAATADSGRLNALRHQVAQDAEAPGGERLALADSLSRACVRACGRAWLVFASEARSEGQRVPVAATSDLLGPLP